MGRIGTSIRNYSTRASDYKLLEEVGYGASATVYRAIYLPINDVVAVKCLDLDRCNANLDDIRREAQTMSLIDHPCAVKAYCSFVFERYLWVVMPFMAEGSCLHLMKIAYPDGFEEPAICSILKESLKALEYLHRHGHIHRDVKAGNILLDSSGAVKLADFGVSAFVFDGGDRKRSRNTFVGTPCWMAPEVLQPGSGYDFKADIWSFGITALELAHGHAPFSKYPPMKVLLMTIQNAPPGLDYDRDKKFSKSFKEMVAMCLVKDQTKRPTSEKLLKHSFFKSAKPPELSLKKLYADLPPLWSRVKALQLKDAAQLALKRMPSTEAEAISQSEYNRGVSAWNFDINDLKAQASLVHDDDELQELEDDDNIKSLYNDMGSSYSKSQHVKSSFIRGQISDCSSLCAEGSNNKCKTIKHDYMELSASDDKKSDPRKDGMGVSPSTSLPEKDLKTSKIRGQTLMHSKSQSGPLHPFGLISHTEKERAFDRCDSDAHSSLDHANRDLRKVPCLGGPLMLPNRASANSLSAPIKSTGGYKEYLDEKSKSNLIQIKGRFSVTSESVENLKGSSPLKKSASVGEWMIQPKLMPTSIVSKDIGTSSSHASFLAPYLCSFIQQTTFQQDLMTNLLNSIQVGDMEACQNGKSLLSPTCSSENDSIEEACFEKERSLLKQISELQKMMISLTEELIVERLKYINLQQRLNTTPVGATSAEEEGEEDSKGKGST